MCSEEPASAGNSSKSLNPEQSEQAATITHQSTANKMGFGWLIFLKIR